MTPRDVLLKTFENERDIGGPQTLTDYVMRDLFDNGFTIVSIEPTAAQVALHNKLGGNELCDNADETTIAAVWRKLLDAR